MTPLLKQKYPAELEPADIELIERAQDADLAQRVQSVLDARNWQRQCEENEKSLQAERTAHERARRWARAWRRVAKRYLGAFDTAMFEGDIYKAQLEGERNLHSATQAAHRMAERRVVELTRRLEEVERQLAETQAALSLADEARVMRTGVGE